MKFRPLSTAIVPAAIVACFAFAAHAHGAVSLGTAAAFRVLGASTVTNTGPTSVDGDIGVYSGTAITGFFGTNENDGPGTFTGSSHQADAVAQQAQIDANAAYVALSLLPIVQDLTGQDLVGLTLTPGVYFFSSTAQLTGALTLDGDGQVNPEFVFQIGSAFTAASNSSIIMIGGADPSQVYFQVGSDATLGTNSSIIGTIIASNSVILNTGADLVGRAIALNGAVTLDSNNIIPEPSSSVLLISGLVSLLTLRRRSRIAH